MATLTLYPTGAGDATGIPSQSPASTYHWDKVDDVAGASDGETTYIYTAGTSYSYDLYSISPTLGAGAISAVGVYYGAESRWAGTHGYVKPCVKVAGDATVYYGTEYTWTEGAWITFHYSSYSWATNPSTSSAWSWSDVYTLQFGVALKAEGSNPQTRCTQCYMVVTYTPETVRSNFSLGDCGVF